MIVVGITNTDRMRDMTIPSDKSERIIFGPFNNGKDTLRIPVPPTAGGAHNFLQFLTKELVPKIENTYRTAPFRLLVGHSLAGLFTAHALMTSPRIFNTFMPISPSLAWDDRSLIQKAQAKLDGIQFDHQFLYMTAGENEMPGTIENLQAFAANIEDANPEGLHRWHRILPDESHPSVVHRSVYNGLETIFMRYRIDEQILLSGNIPKVETHFSEASQFYGYNMDVPEQIINTMGYMQIQFAQQPKKAIKIFRYNTELYPESANVYDSLGDGYSAAGSLQDAKESYEKAIELAEQKNNHYIEIYRSNLQQVTKQLEQNKKQYRE